MKKSKITTGILAIAFIALSVTSCKDNKKEHNNDDGHHTEMKSDDHSKMNHDNSDGHHDNDASTTNDKSDIGANTQKNATTSPIIDAYIQIKNGLVATDKGATAKGGTALLTAFSKFDMTALKGDTHKEYMEIYESAKEHAEHIVKSDITHQREHFETLSTDITDLIALLGTEKTLYQDFCPMANNNKGAYWLSEVKDIKNPYFGDKMMKCGSVKRQIN
ncbi:Probable Co/Zn/Cd efflux system membrane fusion protein [hydrothermal vent metagenome]|uniref:Probable Co/Zn/Cd efflux system membrane fusion protein n=1 Tax=hydrothermal vent metagenome TaxID=652676 RepID=A0A3B0TME1_9ZZZZ